MDTAVRGNLGLSVWPKNTWAGGLEEPGIKLFTFWLVDDPFYFMSHSHS